MVYLGQKVIVKFGRAADWLGLPYGRPCRAPDAATRSPHALSEAIAVEQLPVENRPLITFYLIRPMDYLCLL